PTTGPDPARSTAGAGRRTRTRPCRHPAPSPPRRSGRPSSPSSRRRSRGRGPRSATGAGLDPRALLGDPDVPVDDVLVQLLPAGHWPWVDLAGRDPPGQPLERGLTGQDGATELAGPAR